MVYGVGFAVKSLGSRVWGSGSRVSGLGAKFEVRRALMMLVPVTSMRFRV